MKRLTEKQREAYIILQHKPDGSLREWAKMAGIKHTSFEARLQHMEKKGYLHKEKGRFKFTSDGLEQFMNDDIHDRFIRTKK